MYLYTLIMRNNKYMFYPVLHSFLLTNFYLLFYLFDFFKQTNTYFNLNIISYLI